MWVKRLRKNIELIYFMTSLLNSYDFITMSLLGNKSDLTMSELTILLLDYESLRWHKENVSESPNALVLELDRRRWKKLGCDTCHKSKCYKLGHFQRDYPERQLDRPPTLRVSRTTVAIGDDSDIIVCMSEKDMHETVGVEIYSYSSDAGSSWVLDSGSTFHIYPQRYWFDFLHEMYGSTVTLVDGSTLLIIIIDTIRF
jgi:hypothetical protein